MLHVPFLIVDTIKRDANGSVSDKEHLALCKGGYTHVAALQIPKPLVLPNVMHLHHAVTTSTPLTDCVLPIWVRTPNGLSYFKKFPCSVHSLNKLIRFVNKDRIQDFP